MHILESTDNKIKYSENIELEIGSNSNYLNVTNKSEDLDLSTNSNKLIWSEIGQVVSSDRKPHYSLSSILRRTNLFHEEFDIETPIEYNDISRSSNSNENEFRKSKTSDILKVTDIIKSVHREEIKIYLDEIASLRSQILHMNFLEEERQIKIENDIHNNYFKTEQDIKIDEFERKYNPNYLTKELVTNIHNISSIEYNKRYLEKIVNVNITIKDELNKMEKVELSIESLNPLHINIDKLDMDESRKLFIINDEFLNKIENLTKRNNLLLNEIERLSKQEKDLLIENERLSKTNNEFINKIEVFNIRNKELLKLNENLTIENKEYIKRIDNILIENNNLLDKINKLTEYNKRLSKDSENLSNNNKKLIDEINYYCKYKDDLLNNINNETRYNEKYKSEIEDLSKYNKELLEKIEIISNNEKESLKLLDVISKKYEQLRNCYMEQNSEMLKIQITLCNEQKNKVYIEDSLIIAKSNITKLESQINELNSELKNSKEQLYKQIEDYDSRIKFLNNEFKNLKDQQEILEIYMGYMNDLYINKQDVNYNEEFDKYQQDIQYIFPNVYNFVVNTFKYLISSTEYSNFGFYNPSLVKILTSYLYISPSEYKDKENRKLINTSELLVMNNMIGNKKKIRDIEYTSCTMTRFRNEISILRNQNHAIKQRLKLRELEIDKLRSELGDLRNKLVHNKSSSISLNMKRTGKYDEDIGYLNNNYNITNTYSSKDKWQHILSVINNFNDSYI
ncbi:uncharacterized protein CMU_005300 [Cryptosporidium muris RN66]|uniref:Uncharacterized protein n=1 Tax=Cryptosporidium muris (strain RN66) TaxID=441375 RepID=B6AHB2_CRYMR|nr:uncharacterized protein CMU_005300 [Cryptosporidium muris RN66]EEA07607.1 hypothetical protein, conserved [Cryptosporidium muris RN66]|eukprot:XP_002141956.1 hypothetical protein [Cryptosporidium muris RN66]